jgi:hypothetical protein
MTPQPLPPNAESSDAKGDARIVNDMRIDAAHAFPSPGGNCPPDSASPVPALSLASAANQDAERGAAVQQFRTQAVQLADHLTSRQKDLDRREAELNARAAELESGLRSARLWFTEREAELEQRRERWIRERRETERQLQSARQQLDQQRRCESADLEAKRRAVSRRAEQVDRAWVAVEQLREEVSRMHCEALELRLANEELRAELHPCASAELQQRSLEQIRTRLSDEYRRASEAIARQKAELLALRKELAEQHRILLHDRQQSPRFAAPRRPAAAS